MFRGPAPLGVEGLYQYVPHYKIRVTYNDVGVADVTIERLSPRPKLEKGATAQKHMLFLDGAGRPTSDISWKDGKPGVPYRTYTANALVHWRSIQKEVDVFVKMYQATDGGSVSAIRTWATELTAYYNYSTFTPASDGTTEFGKYGNVFINPRILRYLPYFFGYADVEFPDGAGQTKALLVERFSINFAPSHVKIFSSAQVATNAFAVLKKKFTFKASALPVLATAYGGGVLVPSTARRHIETAYRFLWMNGVYHNDIHGRNILIRIESGNRLTFVLGDFDTTRISGRHENGAVVAFIVMNPIFLADLYQNNTDLYPFHMPFYNIAHSLLDVFYSDPQIKTSDKNKDEDEDESDVGYLIEAGFHGLDFSGDVESIFRNNPESATSKFRTVMRSFVVFQYFLWLAVDVLDVESQQNGTFDNASAVSIMEDFRVFCENVTAFYVRRAGVDVRIPIPKMSVDRDAPRHLWNSWLVPNAYFDAYMGKIRDALMIDQPAGGDGFASARAIFAQAMRKEFVLLMHKATVFNPNDIPHRRPPPIDSGEVPRATVFNGDMDSDYIKSVRYYDHDVFNAPGSIAHATAYSDGTIIDTQTTKPRSEAANLMQMPFNPILFKLRDDDSADD